jgi:hypothetical protein
MERPTSNTQLPTFRGLGVGVFVLTIVVTSCNPVPPLANVHETPEDVARAVLAALAAGDRRALESLAISETEFRHHVWPSLPAARKERNLPFGYVWGDLRQKSAQSLSNVLSEHRGRRYELADVVFDGEIDYGPYAVHRQATFVVRLPSGGTEPLRVCGSMIEKNGVWKVFSFVVDA